MKNRAQGKENRKRYQVLLHKNLEDINLVTSMNNCGIILCLKRYLYIPLIKMIAIR